LADGPFDFSRCIFGPFFKSTTSIENIPTISLKNTRRNPWINLHVLVWMRGGGLSSTTSYYPARRQTLTEALRSLVLRHIWTYNHHWEAGRIWIRKQGVALSPSWFSSISTSGRSLVLALSPGQYDPPLSNAGTAEA
jgi:hypothetical protein